MSRQIGGAGSEVCGGQRPLKTLFVGIAFAGIVGAGLVAHASVLGVTQDGMAARAWQLESEPPTQLTWIPWFGRRYFAIPPFWWNPRDPYCKGGVQA